MKGREREKETSINDSFFLHFFVILHIQLHFRYVMFLFGNRFYAIFLTIWIIGLYVVFTTYHHSSTINQTTSDERVKYLQNEIQTLQEKIREMQGQKNDPTGGCEKINEELKRVKRQLKESTTRTQRMDRKRLFSWKMFHSIASDAPALEYEQLRRKIETQARELTYFTTDQLNKISKKLSEADQTNWRNVLDRFGDQSRSVFTPLLDLLMPIFSPQGTFSFYSKSNQCRWLSTMA